MAIYERPATGTDTSAIHDNESGEISALAEKASPVSADLLLIEDSAAGNTKKKVQIGSLPTGSGAPTDALYVVGATNGTLSAELLITGNTWITGDTTAAGQIKFNVVDSSIGTTQLENLSVTTGKVANDAITYAKVQNVTDARLLGRAAGSAGDTQELTAGSGLSLAGGSLSVTFSSKDILIESPTATEDITFFYTPIAITATEVRTVLVGSGGPTLNHLLYHNTDRSAAGLTLTTGQSYTGTTAGVIAGLSDNTVPAASYVWVETRGVSGTITNAAIHLRYTVD